MLFERRERESYFLLFIYIYLSITFIIITIITEGHASVVLDWIG